MLDFTKVKLLVGTITEERHTQRLQSSILRGIRKSRLTLQNTVVTICTNNFNIKVVWIMPTSCIYVFYTILEINSGFATVCSLWGTNWIFINDSLSSSRSKGINGIRTRHVPFQACTAVWMAAEPTRGWYGTSSQDGQWQIMACHRF
jgi:hypothetical protein